jgi:hypothetical protein
LKAREGKCDDLAGKQCEKWDEVLKGIKLTEGFF